MRDFCVQLLDHGGDRSQLGYLFFFVAVLSMESDDRFARGSGKMGDEFLRVSRVNDFAFIIRGSWDQHGVEGLVNACLAAFATCRVCLRDVCGRKA